MPVKIAEIGAKPATRTSSPWSKLKPNVTFGIRIASDVKRAINN